ncbi:RNA-directed DNA polymerase, eukaryota, reverse transcriptase zinc-binding domain protein [Tanacetum coccineum]
MAFVSSPSSTNEVNTAYGVSTDNTQFSTASNQVSTASTQGEYEMWKLRIEQYFQVQDYALWDVIENGNSFKPVAQTTTNAEGTSTTLVPGPVTADEKTQKKNDVKARSMLLMALPNEHLLTFNQYKDAKTLFAAIQTRLCGMKVKGIASSSSSSSSQNMAFVSSPSSTNEVNTAYGVSTDNTQFSTASNQVSTASTQVESFNCHRVGTSFQGNARNDEVLQTCLIWLFQTLRRVERGEASTSSTKQPVKEVEEVNVHENTSDQDSKVHKESDMILKNKFSVLNEEEENGVTSVYESSHDNIVNASDSEDVDEEIFMEDDRGKKVDTMGASTPNDTDSNLERLCSSVFRHWEWASNGMSCTKGSRIIVGWNRNEVDLSVITFDDQVMHTRIWLKLEKKEFFCSFIYAHNRYIQRRSLWSNLGLHKLYVRNRPWCLLGDFNAALFLDDFAVGSSNIDISMREFKACVENIEVLDVQQAGLKFTWNQKPKGKDGILKKLDRVLTNLEFNDLFQGAHAIFQPYRISDHAPAVLKIPWKVAVKPKPFKFTNILIKNPKFKERALDLDPSNNTLREEEAVNVQAFNELILLEEMRIRAELSKSHRCCFYIVMVSSIARSCLGSFLFHIIKLISWCHPEAWDIVGKDVILAVRDIFINGKRGLRQGEPLSPYLFTLVMEILTLIIKRKVRESDVFAYHRYCLKLDLVNLCFVDDLFLFAHGNTNSIRVIMESLEEFKIVSGLVPSLPKCTAYFCNVTNHVKMSILQILPFEEGRLPVKYLGVPLVSSQMIYKDCKELFEKVQHRVDDWKNKSLSIAGRLQLVNFVIGLLHVFWASVFMLPTRILLDIEQIMRGFLWCNGKLRSGKAKVAWEVVCLPKDKVGLGWRNILKLRPLIRDFIWHKIGDCSGTSVWFDRWCEQSPLAAIVTSRDIFREGFSSNSKVCDLVRNGSLLWPPCWLSKYPSMFSIPSPTLVPNSSDTLEWRDESGFARGFSSHVVWNTIWHRNDKVDWCDVVWFSCCIPRHAVHLWLVLRRRLKTQVQLRPWDATGVMVCPLCETQPDSHDHLFFECVYSQQLVDILPLHKENLLESVCIAKLVVAATLYFIWQERNCHLFKKSKRTVNQVVECIMHTIRLKLLSCHFKTTRSALELINAWNLSESILVSILWHVTYGLVEVLALLEANCNYHQRERVVSGNNYTRVNYNYSIKKAHPSAHRNMAPRAVLMKTGIRTLNTARPINTAHPKTIVYSARSMSHFSKSAQSTVKRPYQIRTSLTNKNFSQKVNTAKGKIYTARPKVVNTARPNTVVVNAVRENQVNAVKALACWGHPQKEDQGYVDSGCSRHMTGNMSYLSDFKEFDRGYVTFRGGAKG